MVLNYGHTLGHALEAATHYKTFTHGEAIAHGMIMANQLAEQLNGLDATEAAQDQCFHPGDRSPASAAAVALDRGLPPHAL